MFDIGFWELGLIGVVALMVIGPERLPGVARTTGMWFGKMRRFVASVKAEVDSELAAGELKKTLAKQMETPELFEIIEETKETLRSMQDTVADNTDTTAAKTAQHSPKSRPLYAPDQAEDPPLPENSASSESSALPEHSEINEQVETTSTTEPVAPKAHDTGG